MIEGIFFRDADINDFKKLFRPELDKVLLSDRIFDRLFKIKHNVSYEKIDLGSCEECGEKVLYLSIKLSNRKGEKLIEGDVWIHGSGLTRYKIKYACHEHPAPEKILHRLVRDLFHTHVHHSSDLPLPPVEAENKAEAKEKILAIYLLKFIAYKRIPNIIELKAAIEDISRARGEIVYAKSFYELFRESLKDSSHLASPFNHFDASFKILIERLSTRLNLVTISIGLVAIMANLYIFQLTLLFQGFIVIKTWYWFVYALPLTVILYLFTEAIRVAQK